MDDNGLFLILIFSVPIFYTSRLFSALSDPTNQPRIYLIAQVIKVIGFWIVFFPV